MRIAKKLGIKAIVTVHAPAAVCSRAIMMLGGKEPRDGKIEVSRCRHCCGSSLPAWLDRTWTYVPDSINLFCNPHSAPTIYSLKEQKYTLPIAS